MKMNEENKELFVIEAGKEIATISDIENVIANIKQQVQPIVADLATAKGRKEIVSNAFRVTKTKTAICAIIDKTIAAREEEIKPTLDLIATLKSKKKIADNELSAFAKEIRQSVTEWEQKEAERVRRHTSCLEELNLFLVFSGSINELKKALHIVKGHRVNVHLMEEYAEEAIALCEKCVLSLEGKIIAAEAREKELQELEELRKREQERVAELAKAELEKEARIKAEAQAAALIEKAEKDRIAAEERTKFLEEEKIRAEERAKIELQNAVEAAKKAEIERVAKEVALAQAEQDARERNKKHISAIRTESKAALLKYVEEDTAKKIILAIDAKEIPNIFIKY